MASHEPSGDSHRQAERKRSLLNTADWAALAFLVIGGINWGLVDAFSLDLIASLFGGMSPVSRVVYLLVGLSAIYLLLTLGRLAKLSAEVGE